MEKDELAELSKVAGVDLNALRLKYRKLSSNNNNNRPITSGGGTTLVEDEGGGGLGGEDEEGNVTPHHQSIAELPSGKEGNVIYNHSSGKLKGEKTAKEVDELLSKYFICQACQGLGTIKTIYNFMTMEKTCEACDGESVKLKEEADEIIHSEHMER